MSYVPPAPVYPPPYAAPKFTYTYEPAQDERTFGTLSHALQMAGTWIAPLVILLSKKDKSRFVAFHALQALLLQGVVTVFWFCGIAIWMVFLLAIVLRMPQGQPPHEPPMALFVLFPVIWLFGIAQWVVVLLATIFYSIKAGKGEWAKYPVLGGWAARMLHIDLTMRYQPPPVVPYAPYVPPQPGTTPPPA